MDKKLDCEIVRDLLPSYVDKLTSETTNRAVEEHLSGCPDCAEALRLMKEPEPAENHPNAEVDYL
ncbi:MAG: zf-HC2 domain-containing protein, partial [Lawsonibacter sp.]|nr:zf-HC2 domain-containing protein [Lawsonibacter sp.]